MIFLNELKQASAEKKTNHKLTMDDEGMVVLIQKGENENLTKNIFRVMGGNERSFTLIKPKGNDRVKARSLPPNCVACYIAITKRNLPKKCFKRITK